MIFQVYLSTRTMISTSSVTTQNLNLNLCSRPIRKSLTQHQPKNLKLTPIRQNNSHQHIRTQIRRILAILQIQPEMIRNMLIATTATRSSTLDD